MRPLRALLLLPLVVQAAEEVPPPATPAPPPVTVPAPPEPPSRRPVFAELDVFSGARFGGIIGAALQADLTVRPDWPVAPELVAGVGISGTKLGLGARWSLHEREWVIARGRAPFMLDTSPSLTPRAVAFYRWEDGEREPDFWRGIVANDGWWLGGELGIAIGGLALDVAVTWNEEHDEGPRWTLAYGFDF